MSKLKAKNKEQKIFTAGITRDRALFAPSKLKTILSKSAIIFLVLLIASLSTLVFSRTSFWTTNLVNLSLDSDFTLFIDVTNNRVGINTSDPTATLQVNGSVRVVPLVSCDTIDTDADGLLACGTDATGSGGGGSPWNASGTAVYLNDTSDSVGIGTSSPDAKLHVVGTGNVLKVDGSDVVRPPDRTDTRFTMDYSTASDIIVDMVLFNDTYIYVVGYGPYINPSNNIIIAKFNKSLQMEWNLTINHTEGYSDAYAIDVDDSGAPFKI